MEELHAKKLVAALAAAYPTNKLDDDSIRVYTRMLLDLDYDATNAAIARLVATCKFPPSIAEIREATLALVIGEVRAGGEAWGAALRLRSPRPVEQLVDLDPVMVECLDRLGLSERDTAWRCGVEVTRWRFEPGENEASDRARFIDLYDRMAAQRRKSEASEGLPAVQRFRALQEQRRRELTTGEAQPLGKLLVLPAGGER